MKKGNDLKPHIGIFGRRNNGKSSFINSIVGQDVSIVSDFAGTTTDPVQKTVEIFGVGPVIIIDTAGIDDSGELGLKRVKKTTDVIKNIDVAILLMANNQFDTCEGNLISDFDKYAIPYLIIHNQSDIEKVNQKTIDKVKAFSNTEILEYSVINPINKFQIIEAISKEIPKTAYQKPSLFGNIIKSKDIVLLITPIDSEAPEGRMILPQVMAWRDVLDKSCICISIKETELHDFLKLGIKPNLTVTDSQVFNYVSDILPKDYLLTSFSILFANLKGKLTKYIEGTKHIDFLKDNDKVLILESCTHQVSCEDIGRHKIPNWLKSFTKKELLFEIVSGTTNIPDDIESYALVIQCGGCVATAKQINSRINFFEYKNIPITNYGLTIAFINGIFNRVVEPFVKL